jgi:Ni/Fe-hydrogenase 1 B-type cytochrome subunit
MSHVEHPRTVAAELELGAPAPFGSWTSDDVARFAAMGAEPGMTDLLDRSLVADATLRGCLSSTIRPVSFDPATPERPYSISEVVDVDGQTVRIARGRARDVVEQVVHPDRREQAAAILVNARKVASAYRTLAVAVQRGDGGFELVGYIPVRAWASASRHHGRLFDYHAVWDLWVRLCHWSWVGAILILTVTGYLIANPWWIPAGWAESDDTGYFMGFVRLVHYLAAVVLILVLLIRAWSLSTSKIPYDRWHSLVPFRNGTQLRNMWRTFTAYLFVRPSTAPTYFGHNPLQQFTYTMLYVVLIVQIIIGFALWGLYDTSGWFWGLFQWINNWLGTQQTRLLHYAIMWLILLFVPLHVYLSVRADSTERSGAISAMVSGGRWVRRGATFEDWPLQDPTERAGEASADAKLSSEYEGTHPRDGDPDA